MRRRASMRCAVVVAAVSAVLIPTSGTSAQVAPREWSPEEQAVIDAASVGPLALNDGFDVWEGAYHSDWTYWRMGRAETRSRAVHMDLVRAVLTGGARVVGFHLIPVDVVVRGETAILRLNAVETLERTDGTRETVRYSSADVYTREGGTWKVLSTSIVYDPS